MIMHNPPHPGTVVKRALIESTGLTVTKAARLLGVGRISLSKILNGKGGISAEMAVRLSITLNTSSELWLGMQTMYDLWQVECKRKSLKAKPLQKAA